MDDDVESCSQNMLESEELTPSLASVADLEQHPAIDNADEDSLWSDSAENFSIQRLAAPVANPIPEDSTADNISRDDYVLNKLEEIIVGSVVLQQLTSTTPPQIADRSFYSFTQSRTFTSMILVASYCHELLQEGKTTTTRELYYFFVTHFRNQKECDTAIWDLANHLGVPRSRLGLYASPKGWCCGCFELYNIQDDNSLELSVNARNLNDHGLSISAGLVDEDGKTTRLVNAGARCIVVVEKEGIYNRLSEEKFFLEFPCILITGKGFPDVATRRLVQHLHRSFDIPVYGLCDCNPFGVSLLHSYHYNQVRTNRNDYADNRMVDAFHIEWLGLLPSDLPGLELDPNVYQAFTNLDKKRLDNLIVEDQSWWQPGSRRRNRVDELALMKENAFKVELEALNWKGVDFLCRWLQMKLESRMQERQRGTGIAHREGLAGEIRGEAELEQPDGKGQSASVEAS